MRSGVRVHATVVLLSGALNTLMGGGPVLAQAQPQPPTTPAAPPAAVSPSQYINPTDRSREVTIAGVNVTVPAPDGFSFDDNKKYHDTVQLMANQTTKENVYAIFATASDQERALTEPSRVLSTYSVRTFAASENQIVTAEAFENIRLEFIQNWDKNWKAAQTAHSQEKVVDLQNGGQLNVKFRDKYDSFHVISMTDDGVAVAGVVYAISYRTKDNTETLNQFDAMALLRIKKRLINLSAVVIVRDDDDTQKATHTFREWVEDVLKANSPTGGPIRHLPIPPVSTP